MIQIKNGILREKLIRIIIFKTRISFIHRIYTFYLCKINTLFSLKNGARGDFYQKRLPQNVKKTDESLFGTLPQAVF